MKYYVFTLDSHDCYGPFNDHKSAIVWAWFERKMTAYQITAKPVGDPLRVIPVAREWRIA